jgi:hypothetical protein
MLLSLHLYSFLESEQCHPLENVCSICIIVSNVLEGHNIFTHHVIYGLYLDWNKKNDISNKLSNFYIPK